MDNAGGQQGLIDVEGSVDHDAVLGSLRTFHEEYLRRERGLVLLAVQWARLNPGLKRTWPDGTPNTSSGGVDPEELLWEKLAAKGCPHFDDLAIPTFAIAAGLSEFQARRLMRESLMLVHFLPRVWQAAFQGTVDVWRVRKLAEECWQLTPEAVDYVDRLMSLSTARHTEGGREGVIKEARLRFMPEDARAEEEQTRDDRGFEIFTDEGSSAGIAYASAVLDLPDALDLEKAVAAGAQMLKELGSDAPLALRRSWALGDIARGAQIGETPLLGSEHARRAQFGAAPVFRPDCACALGLHPPGRAAPPTAMGVYLHFAPDSIVPDPAGVTDLDGLHPQNIALSSPGLNDQGRALPTTGRAVVRVEGPAVPRGYVVSSEVVRSWFERPSLGSGPKIFFRPVIDLNEHARVDAYEVPDRLKERVQLRDGTCVFPWCGRKAQNTDCDHTVAWQANGTGGPTCSCNLAALCRTHHRAKTHADNHGGNRYTWWNYEPLGEGQYLWTGPKGTVLLRTNTGVIELAATSAQRGVEPALPARIVAAEKVITRISAQLLDVDPAEREDDEKNLEFPHQPVKPRPPSWRRFADVPDVRDDPARVAPGSLADRIVNGDKGAFSTLEGHLQHLLTDVVLNSTPEQRRAWERARKLREKALSKRPLYWRSGRFVKRQQVVGSKVVWDFIPDDD